MVATAIALGSVTVNWSPSNAATYTGSTPTDFTMSGSLQFAEVSTILTGKIKSNQCPGQKSVRQEFKDNIITTSKTVTHKLNPLICGTNIATANAKINTTPPVTQSNNNIFKGSLSIDGFINRSDTGNEGGVFSSVRSTLVAKTIASNVTGQFNKSLPLYEYIGIPNGFSTVDTEISYWIKQDRPLLNQRQSSVQQTGFFLRTQSSIDGVIDWNDDGIDLSGVKNGTFLIEWGDVVGRTGILSLELEQGCVVKSIDTEDFEGWLPQIGFCSPIILSNSLPNFGFDFAYDLGSFDQPVEFGLRYGTNSAIATPEPITIIGTLTSLGFGLLFKRKYGQRVK